MLETKYHYHHLDLIIQEYELLNQYINPDWIETAAEQVGYSKSPIAKFLEWIDRFILQIENWLIKIWNRFQVDNKNSN